ncbi:MAG TPA: Hsp20/alpha crystallin family protein [Candidatus Binatia bacterium]|nr:Hsp20/alpha crystallin family protein [Candidatus Binatia bacterium]
MRCPRRSRLHPPRRITDAARGQTRPSAPLQDAGKRNRRRRLDGFAGRPISGERREEKEERDRDYYRREQSYGSFLRTIPLPPGVDPDKAEASFKRGVLTVTLPKTASAARKRIDVRAA